jgi:hypothetical protein
VNAIPAFPMEEACSPPSATAQPCNRSGFGSSSISSGMGSPKTKRAAFPYRAVISAFAGSFIVANDVFEVRSLELFCVIGPPGCAICRSRRRTLVPSMEKTNHDPHLVLDEKLETGAAQRR